MAKNKELKTVDCTPTWQGILPVLISLIEDSNYEGRKVAIEELTKMAKLADNYNSLARQYKKGEKVLKK